MSLDIPATTKQWNVTATTGFDKLALSEQPVPKVGDNQVLVKIRAGSLNYRDLIIPLGQYPFPVTPNVVPGSDGAGTVVAIGKDVTRFKVGDDVLTLFNQRHISHTPDLAALTSGLGGALNGAFREYGAFDENGLVAKPKTLSFLEGATLPCAGLTAWNALFGLTDKKLAPGQWVLTQGTGGVSIFALQFAKATGARVIATTSSPAKAKLLEKLGADHIINYNETANWGEKAKELTGGVGVDHVVEVAGAKSMAQSLAAVKIDGVITVIGFVGGQVDKEPSFLECLTRTCTVRGIVVGSRGQFEDMCRAFEANPNLRPVVDEKVFKLDQLKEAYEYQLSGKHQAKVCIEIS